MLWVGLLASLGQSMAFLQNRRIILPPPSVRAAAHHEENTDTTSTSIPNLLPWQDSVKGLSFWPKLIVFDLDNTLWTPELYQIRQRDPPQVNRDIRLFPDVADILHFCDSLAGHKDRQFELAIASRTSKQSWAHQLLEEFVIAPPPSVAPRDTATQDNNRRRTLRSYFRHIEIRTGSKKQHLANIRAASVVPYSSMIFMDDDARLNLGETSQLGVLSVHTPRGITTAHFVRALQKFDELHRESQQRGTGSHDGNNATPWMGYILNSDSLGIPETPMTTGKKCKGRVKFYSTAKRFGFVIDEDTGQEYFVHESKVPASMNIRTGDRLIFETFSDGKGRPAASIPQQSFPQSAKQITTPVTIQEQVSMHCFSMSQPFAALLLNGVKTVESRNNPMFQKIKPGTRVLLHCGRKDWPDQQSYIDILRTRGYADDEIAKLSRLPPGVQRGSIVGVITVGVTWMASDDERKSAQLQAQVVAPFEGIGKFCTAITDAKWLKNSTMAQGGGGIYTAQVNKSDL